MNKTVRTDFPFLNVAQPVVYLDNAATTHKPQSVIDAMANFYAYGYGTVHRGIYASGEDATQAYNAARAALATFINADPSEIAFVSGATHGVNLVARAWGDKNITAGDSIVATEMEHHANLLPWQELAARTGAVLTIIPVLPDGTLDCSTLGELITKRTKLVAVTHISNVTGIKNPIELIRSHADRVGARLFVDAAQSAPFGLVDVRKMRPDFLTFSGHKMLGPTGIGVLYMAGNVQPEIDPYHYGGGMVHGVTKTSSEYRIGPEKFEAGTPPVAQAVGLHAAVNYLSTLDMDAVRSHCANLADAARNKLTDIHGVQLIGSGDHIVSFTVEGIHPHDVAAYLDSQGIAVRAGDHCAQPYRTALGIPGTVRASFYLYNTMQDVDQLVQSLQKLSA